jgi:hypothetical protein
VPNRDHPRKQASQYDKIIKENLEVTLPVIIRDVLGLDILLSEELPDDVQHTKERKPDALKKVTDTAGNTYVLQVEFQVEDEAGYKLFLRSNNPEVKMLAILANFGRENSYQAVKSIVDGIQSATKGDFAGSRYFKQLRIFVQLRSSVEQQFEKAMETVTKFFKEENDFLYRRGEAKKSHAVVENLIVKLGLTDEQAAEVAEVDVAYVEKVRAELQKK